MSRPSAARTCRSEARSRAARPLLVLLLALGGPGCAGRRADARDCDAIFARIVALELREIGYRDPVLAAHKQRELRGALAPLIAQCEGRRLPPRALACMRQASSAEQLSHVCLR